MSMHRLASVTVIAAGLLAATTAQAQRITATKTSNSPIISTTAKPVNPAARAADVAAMARASEASLFIMRASYLASSKGQTAATKTLAADLIAYHTQALSDFRGATLATGGTAPGVKLTADQERRLTALEAATGAEFERLYRTEVASAQEKAAQALLAHGKAKDGNLIVVAQANRQGNQIAQLNAKTKAR